MKKVLNYFKILFGVLLLDVLMLVLAIFWPSQVPVTIKRVSREIATNKRKKKK